VASVKSFGYTVIETTDLEGWKAFGQNILGMQLGEESDDRLLLRMDEHTYRHDVRRSDRDGVRVAGLEVAGPVELAELVARLRHNGFDVTEGTAELIEERRVRGLASFLDPDGSLTIELYHGLLRGIDPLVSPAGNEFVSGEFGIGHVLQVVTDVDAYKRLYIDILGYRLSDEIRTGEDSYATFLHCNSRHHSFAFAETDGVRPVGVGHLMVEVTDLDMVGRAIDKARNGEAVMVGELGKHTNDKMISMYIKSPSGFGIEYGFGGIEIDDATWNPRLYDEAHYWGHDKIAPSV
jgi:2,3-dihydroxybiphenyl 1,2-dioxygenase